MDMFERCQTPNESPLISRACDLRELDVNAYGGSRTDFALASMKRHYLNIRITWDTNCWLSNVKVLVRYNLQPIGESALVQCLASDFNFEWACQSADVSLLDPFVLQPEKFAAIGNRYEVFSYATGDLLATIKDHKWNLIGLRDVSCECVAGQLSIAETSRSNLMGRLYSD